MPVNNCVPAVRVLDIKERTKLRTLFVRHRQISSVAVAVGISQPAVTYWFQGLSNNMDVQQEVLLRAPDLIDADREQFLEVQQYARAG